MKGCITLFNYFTERHRQAICLLLLSLKDITVNENELLKAMACTQEEETEIYFTIQSKDTLAILQDMCQCDYLYFHLTQ